MVQAALESSAPKCAPPKLGHVGTLDPMAQGVLPMALGTCTRAIRFLPDSKRYEGRFKFGVRTTSDDVTGDVTVDTPLQDMSACTSNVAHSRALKQHIEATRMQTPPAVAALHTHGQRMYSLASPAPAAPRPVYIRSVSVNGWCDARDSTAPPAARVHAARWPRLPRRHSRAQPAAGTSGSGTVMMNYNAERPLQVTFASANGAVPMSVADLEDMLRNNCCAYPEALVDVKCVGGVYMRALARDAGVALPNAPPATLSSLTRLESNSFTATGAVAYSDVCSPSLREHVLHPDVPFRHLPAVLLDGPGPKRLRLAERFDGNWNFDYVARLPIMSSSALQCIVQEWNDDSNESLSATWIEEGDTFSYINSRGRVRVYARVDPAMLQQLQDGVPYRRIPPPMKRKYEQEEEEVDDGVYVLFLGLATTLQVRPLLAEYGCALVRRVCTLLQTSVVADIT